MESNSVYVLLSEDGDGELANFVAISRSTNSLLSEAKKQLENSDKIHTDYDDNDPEIVMDENLNIGYWYGYENSYYTYKLKQYFCALFSIDKVELI